MTIIGIDAGGTKTRVVYGPADAFRRKPHPSGAIREVTLGPGNFRLIGLDGVRALIRRITVSCGIEQPVHTGVVAGFAGAGTCDSQAQIRESFHMEGFDRRHVRVTSDVGLLLCALRNHGILLIAGTGSICMGRAGGREDTTVRAGGWGYRLGDPGSGYHLGMRAIDAALRMEDGIANQPPTALYEAVKAYFNLKHLSELTDRLYAGQMAALSFQEQVAGLSGAVLKTAQEGDEVARRIVSEAVTAMAEYIHAVHHRLNGIVREVGLYGGLFKDPYADALLIEPLETHGLLRDLDLRFKKLGIKENDPDPLIEAVAFSVERQFP